MAGRAHIVDRGREPAVVLEAGSTRATFLPGAGMLGVSLVDGDHELLALPRSVARWRAGDVTGLPLLHPWANRLGGRSYGRGRDRVDLRGLDLPTDPDGLPIHGCVRAQAFELSRLATSAGGVTMETRFDASADPLTMRCFPFPHELTLAITLRPGRMRVTTTMTATGDRPVPVSFGFHPYLRLPSSPRRDWRLRLPARDEVVLDARQLPTGETIARAREDEPIGTRTFDHLFALGADRSFALDDGVTRLAVVFDEGYPYAQVYAPPRAAFACIEPMTAPVDALRRGTAPLVEPGAQYRAAFTLTTRMRR